MKKTEIKAIAKEAMLEAIGVAYYRISDSGDYSDEDTEAIIQEMNKLGEKMAKAIRGNFITY